MLKMFSNSQVLQTVKTVCVCRALGNAVFSWDNHLENSESLMESNATVESVREQSPRSLSFCVFLCLSHTNLLSLHWYKTVAERLRHLNKELRSIRISAV